MVPFGPFFAIWLVIFASCLGFAVWHALPGNLNDQYLRHVGWYAAALFAGNIAWEVYVPRKGFAWPSFYLILVELVLALALIIAMQPYVAELTGVAFWFGAAPLYFFAGWVSVATFVSLSSTLVLNKSTFDPRTSKGSAIIIGVAGIFVAAIAIWTESAVYAASALWGLLGVMVGTRIKKEPIAATTAAATSMALILASVAAS